MVENKCHIYLKGLYSRRQKKVYTSLNRSRIKSNKDRIDFKPGNKAGIHYNYFDVYNMTIGPLLQFLQLFITEKPENQSCKYLVNPNNYELSFIFAAQLYACFISTSAV